MEQIHGTISIKKKQMSIWLAVIVFIFASIVVHLIAAQGRIGTIIDGGDTDYFINPFLELNRGFLALKLESNGVPEYSPATRLLYSLPAVVLTLVLNSPSLVNFLYFSVLFALSGISAWILLREMRFSNSAIWLGSIFFFLNPYVYMRTHTPIIHLELTYAALPILLVLFRKVLHYKTFSLGTTLLIGLLFLLISRATNMYLLYLIGLPIGVFILNSLPQWKVALHWKNLIPLYALLLFTNAMFLAPSVLQYTSFSSNFITSYANDYYRFSIREVQSNLSILDTLAGFGNYAWQTFYGVEKPGLLGFALFAVVKKEILLGLAIIPALWALGNLFHPRPILAIAALLFLFLAAGYSAPFGFIYAYIGDLPIYKDFFRDSWGYWSMPFITLLCIGIGLGIDRLVASIENIKVEGFAKFTLHLPELSVIGLILVNICLYFIFPGKLIQSTWHVHIPEVYFTVSEFFRNNAYEEKVLSLPVTNQAYGYTSYTWGYMGPDPLSKMAPIYLQDRFFSTITSQNYLNAYDDLLTPGSEQLATFLKDTKTKYVMIRKDFDPAMYEVSFTAWQEIVEKDSCFSKIFDESSIAVYVSKCVDSSAISISSAEPSKNLKIDYSTLKTEKSLFDLNKNQLVDCTGKTTTKIQGPSWQITPDMHNLCLVSEDITTDKTAVFAKFSYTQSLEVKIPLFRYCLWSRQQNRCLFEGYGLKATDAQYFKLPPNDVVTLLVYPSPFSWGDIQATVSSLKLESLKTENQSTSTTKTLSIPLLHYSDLEKGVLNVQIPTFTNADSSYISLATQDTGTWRILGPGQIDKTSEPGNFSTIWKVTNGSNATIVYMPQIAYLVGLLCTFGTYTFAILVWGHGKISKKG